MLFKESLAHKFYEPKRHFFLKREILGNYWVNLNCIKIYLVIYEGSISEKVKSDNTNGRLPSTNEGFNGIKARKHIVEFN